jgi:hypothetical protein
MAEKTLLKCLLDHLRLDNENLSLFREGMNKLTPQDKAELRMQFAKEFGYTVIESQTQPKVESGAV